MIIIIAIIIIILIYNNEKKEKKARYYKEKLEHYDILKQDGDFRKKLGRKFIQVTTHGGSCELCKKWEGKVLIDDVFCNGTKGDGNYPLFSQAIEEGLFHKGCRHGITTYYPELEEKD